MNIIGFLRTFGKHHHLAGAALSAALLCAAIPAQAAPQTIVRNGDAVMVLEPYAPNILRVTISKQMDFAMRKPGYGVVGTPNDAGWNTVQDDKSTVLRSAALAVTAPVVHPVPRTGTSADIGKFFSGSTTDMPLMVVTVAGHPLFRLQGWEMAVPNHKDNDAELAAHRRPTDDPFFEVGATFSAAPDEHDYGVGQNQLGFMDRHLHSLDCQHYYRAPAGPTICVPFFVTSQGYAILWDNPSRTRFDFGFNDVNKITSQVGQRVSFFIIAGDYDAMYRGYRLLTGDVPMLPKGAYGYIQSKQRYASQAEVMAVAKGYRDRHLPLDTIVIDWFTYTKMGQMDMDPALWPDPAAMNRELHAMGIHTMISVWPRFTPGSRYYDTVLKNGWFTHMADGTPIDGQPYDQAGSDIDTTNPAAAKWYWSIINENYVKKGFDAFWADETEPDLPPGGSYFSVGPGTQYYNVYPYFHTAAFYNGMRKDMNERALILARDAYLGAQHNGSIFWSSDIYGTWDTLKRQISTGLNFVASGMPYWSTDIGGWQYLPASHTPQHPPLLDPSDARDNIHGYDDYPELYTRWFEYGAFQPNFRAHGSRDHDEVWSYGAQAEPILEKYLRLRYQLMPYIYSLGYYSNQTGAPFMRGLFLDFGSDPNVADIGDEYMFGPALLVAPVTEQGATSRRVYLPAGADWYNFWTNEKLHGGQWITAAAPIDTLPLFVRAGSIIPMGAAIENTGQKQAITELRVYPGANGGFTLYNDDGVTYAYEKGANVKGGQQVTQISWDDAQHKLTSTGAAAWPGPAQALLKIAGD